MAHDTAEYKTCVSSSSTNSDLSRSAVIDGKRKLDATAEHSSLKSLGLDNIGIQCNHGLIGSGTFTDVYRCDMEAFGQVAVKIFKVNVELRVELHELTRISHPNLVQVIKIYGANAFEYDANARLTLVLDLCHGNLSDLLHGSLGRSKRCVESCLQRLHAVLDIASGIDYIHARNILHRDVCSKNCFMAAPIEEGAVDMGPVKLGEFTTARLNDEHMTDWTGSAAYLAPEEMDEDEAYSFPVDVYACSILLHEAACRKPPYNGQDTDHPMFALSVFQGLRPNAESIPPVCDYKARLELIALLEESWRRGQDQRPLARDFRSRLFSVISACSATAAKESRF